MTTLLTAIPSTLIIGDSLDVLLSPTNYPASAGWVVNFAIAGIDTFSKDCTASGDAHALAVTSAESGARIAGQYRYRLRASLASAVETFETGVITLAADIGAATPDTLSPWEERTLTIVEAALNGTLSGEMRRYMIAGRQVETFAIGELIDLRNKLQIEIARKASGGARATMTIGSAITVDPWRC